MVMYYHIAGNFRGVLIFVIFVTDLSHKICTPRKFATVGKGCLEKVAASVNVIVIERMASISNLLSVFDHRTQ